MSNRVAVIGVGMTKFMRRAQESPGELAAQAVRMALEDSGLDIDDIDAVTLGTAPDAFDGVHMKGEHLIAGAGGANKPYMRHFIGGATGVMSPIHGWMHVASGKYNTCMVVAEEKMSPCTPHPAGAFITIFDRVTEQPLELTLIHIFALEMARFMHVYGYSERDLAEVSAMIKKNALHHPAAQVAVDITADDVLNSPLLSWPVKRFDISPTSDAAVAIILANERVARALKKAPVFIEGVGFRLETAYWCARDLCYPDYVAMAARDAYKMAGVVDPARDIDFFEPYDPFDYKALHHLNGLLLDKTGRKVRELFESGNLHRDGTHPMCPSGGALGVGNPIAATGLMKIAELYFQLSGQAGKRQLQRTLRRGVAQAWGDLMQAGTVVVMGSDGASPVTGSRWNNMKREDLPGTSIKSVDDVPNISDTPDLRYAWDNGFAISTYLDGLRKGKIRGSLDTRTNRMMVPSRPFSEIADLAPVTNYFNLPDSGEVKTFTLSHVNWDSSPLPKGKVNIFAVIALDGITEDMGLVHLLGEVKPKDVKIGMKVKAVWQPESKRTGSILDIKYFAPLGRKKADLDITQIKPVESDVLSMGQTEGKIPLSYRYTAGIAGSKFYTDLSKGTINGTYSADRDEILLPPAMFDEETLAILDPDKAARAVDPGSGYIRSFTVVYEDRQGKMLEHGQVLVQVEFPGTSGSIFGLLELNKGEAFEEGSPVKLVKPKKIDGPDKVIFKLK
ncbi:MAG: thiolase domain-containing protein [Desulfocapsaceae bacterium]|jgi:acetyl-CoA C-acetyltransferase|nr:thiolase domain-containing protein [Desulfocapsaceae bacterium]